MKAREAAFQAYHVVRERGPFAGFSSVELEADLAEYRSVCLSYGGFELLGSRAFEVGCGQRPYRLLYLAASGVDVYGADLDAVVFDLPPRRVVETWRANGPERAVKTAARYVLSDVFENRRMKRALTREAGSPFDWPSERIRRGSAADIAVWPDAPVDFVYSEDVFEHIPLSELPLLCERIREQLTDRGIALIRPNVFTGITGGHSIDYYDLSRDRRRSTPPWDHLRGATRTPNTFLNRCSRSDYRELFGEHFRVLDERVKRPNAGREFMTPNLRKELSAYADEELFSNQVRWVLAKT